MATGFSTMSLMRVAGGTHVTNRSNPTTPHTSPMKDESLHRKKSYAKVTSVSSLEEKLSVDSRSSTTRNVSKKLDFNQEPKKGGIVLDLVVSCNVDTMYEMFIGEKESALWSRFMQRRKYEDIKIGKWEQQESDGAVMQRELEYMTGFNSAFIRGKHKTYENQSVLHSSKASSYVIESKARVPTIPVGDCMYTVLQWCFSAKDKDSCLLQVSYEVVYTKKSSLQKMIDKSTASGIKKAMQDYRTALATIVNVRDALPVHKEVTEYVVESQPFQFNMMFIYKIFGLLMEHPHSFLATACLLYTLIQMIYPQEDGVCQSDEPSTGEDLLLNEQLSPISSANETEYLQSKFSILPSSALEFCKSGVLFWICGFLFKLLVLTCHWVMTNMDIFFDPLMKILTKAFVVIAKAMAPLLLSLRVRNDAEAVLERNQFNSGQMSVPAAAEAAAVVAAVAKMSGLTPAEQAKAVKGLRDKKQAQLVNHRESVGVNMEDASGISVEEVFENQRFQPFRSWGNTWPGHMLPTDCGRWSNREGQPKVGTASQMFELVAPPLPPNWLWLESEWQIDLSGLKQGRVDKDGFYYGTMTFSSIKNYPPKIGSGKRAGKNFVRRRRWCRTRIRSDKIRDALMGKDIQADLSDKDDPSIKAKIETLLGWKRKEDDAEQYSKLDNEALPHHTEDAADTNADAEEKDVILEEIFEQEQRIGSHSEWTIPHDMTNLKTWATRDGSISSSSFNEVAPVLPPGWKWVGDWNIDNSTVYSSKLDYDGWTYGKDFIPTMINGESTKFPSGVKEQHIDHKARRRRWVRHRRRIIEEEGYTGEEIPSPVPDRHLSHSSRQINALDLPPSPRDMEETTANHKRTKSKHLVDALDLSASYTVLGEEEKENKPCPVPPLPADVKRKITPLKGGMKNLEKYSSLASSLASLVDESEVKGEVDPLSASSIGSPRRLSDGEIEETKEVEEDVTLLPVLTDTHASLLTDDTAQGDSDEKGTPEVAAEVVKSEDEAEEDSNFHSNSFEPSFKNWN